MTTFIPTDEQWEKMKKHIKSDKYKKEDFFVFETLAVGDKIVPNRYMKLTPALLEVMEQDAKKGVSLMLNHNWSQVGVQSIPIGKVFDARIASSSQEGETTTLYTTQYILRDDSKVDGYSKNDIINLIESGILEDTSVGWGTTMESYKCSICRNSIYDFDKCKHIPGQKYIVDDTTEEVRECIILAEPPAELHEGNNVLMENSIVFDGAYPNAVIQSAVGDGVETSNGLFKPLNGKEKLSEGDLVIGYSTSAGNVNLLYKESIKKGEVEEMKKRKLSNEEVEETKTTTEVEETVEATETTETTEVDESAEVETTVETVENAQANETEEVTETSEEETTETTEEEETEEPSEEETSEEDEVEVSEEALSNAILEKFDNISDSVEKIVELAKEGLAHREKVIENALESGVHSMGNAFDKEIFTKTFDNMKTADIEKMGKAWEEQAEEKFSKEKISKQDVEIPEREDAIKPKFGNFKTDNY